MWYGRFSFIVIECVVLTVWIAQHYNLDCWLHQQIMTLINWPVSGLLTACYIQSLPKQSSSSVPPMQSSTPSQTNDSGIHLSTGNVCGIPRGQRNSASLHEGVSVLRISVVDNETFCHEFLSLDETFHHLIFSVQWKYYNREILWYGCSFTV